MGLEDALDALKGFGPEYAGGLANHGPMAAEALDALGRPEDALPWAERYRRHISGSIPPKKRVTVQNHREALGDLSRHGDWRAFFEQQLVESSWREVVGRWAGTLAPGFIGAAVHGVIRTAHAARALGKSDTPLRRGELAEGLAYWASSHHVLPEVKDDPSHLVPSQALSYLPLLPEKLRRTGGLIKAGLVPLDDYAPFGRTVDLVDTEGNASAFLSDLAQAFARVYLANADATGRVITFIHTVTGPSAVRLLLPHADPRGASRLLRYAWQGNAAIYCAYVKETAHPRVAPPKTTWEELATRAVASMDEHAIKFTEACKRENAILPDDVYLAAAAHAVERLGG